MNLLLVSGVALELRLTDMMNGFSQCEHLCGGSGQWAMDIGFLLLAEEIEKGEEQGGRATDPWIREGKRGTGPGRGVFTRHDKNNIDEP